MNRSTNFFLKSQFIVNMVDGRINGRIKRGKTKFNTERRGIFNTFGDDLLREIFIRLSDCQTAIRCSAVCKSWSSLIRSPDVVHSFHRLEPAGPSRPYTHLLRWERLTNFGTFCQLSSVIRSDPLLGKPLPSGTRLDFLPWPVTPDVKVRATLGDLLLVSRSRREYGLCNPLTGQSLALPRAPNIKVGYFGLACESKSCEKQLGCNCNIRFRVVLIGDHFNDLEDDDSLFLVAIFCSETGQWTKSEFKNTPVASNGSMHWLIHNCIVAFDPFNHQNRCHHIKLPADLRCLVPVGLLGGRRHCKVLLGSVQGRLRLSQVMRKNINRPRPSLRVWELTYSSGDGSSPPTPWWLLVHDSEIEDGGRLRVVAFHPDDGDVIFLGCDYDSNSDSDRNQVYQYDVAKRKLVADGNLPWLDMWEMFRTKCPKVFTLSHRSWPTLIPPLPLV